MRISRAVNDLLETTMNLMNHVVSNRDKALGSQKKQGF